MDYLKNPIILAALTGGVYTHMSNRGIGTGSMFFVFGAVSGSVVGLAFKLVYPSAPLPVVAVATMVGINAFARSIYIG
jgi:hypothetical protein